MSKPGVSNRRTIQKIPCSVRDRPAIRITMPQRYAVAPHAETVSGQEHPGIADARPVTRIPIAPPRPPRIARYARHSAGAYFAGSVAASAGNGPEPGAGSDDDALPAAKHYHAIAPACITPFFSGTRAVGVSALSGAEGTSTSVFAPPGATRAVNTIDI